MPPIGAPGSTSVTAPATVMCSSMLLKSAPHRVPSGAAASSGRGCVPPGMRNTVVTPRGVVRPTASEFASTHQRFPSAPAMSAAGAIVYPGLLVFGSGKTVNGGGAGGAVGGRGVGTGVGAGVAGAAVGVLASTVGEGVAEGDGATVAAGAVAAPPRATWACRGPQATSRSAAPRSATGRVRKAFMRARAGDHAAELAPVTGR